MSTSGQPNVGGEVLAEDRTDWRPEWHLARQILDGKPSLRSDEQWLLLAAEVDRLRELAEVKYELLASERGHDITEYLEPRIRKLYMGLNAEARWYTGVRLLALLGIDARQTVVTDLDNEPVDKWNRLISATATAMVHWLANARWAVIEHRDADRLRKGIEQARDVLRDAFGHADAPYTPAALAALAILDEVDTAEPEKPEGAHAAARSRDGAS